MQNVHAYMNLTQITLFVSFVVCVDLSSALSLGSFLIPTLQLGPLLTVRLVCALEWLSAICVANAEPHIAL